MSTHRFFWDGIINDGQAELKGPEARHIVTVLRMRRGDQAVLCDGNGHDYRAELLESDAGRARFEILSEITETAEPELRTSLYLAYTKGERLAYAVQKSVELGVTDIFLYESERCVSRHSDGKAERFSRIASEACKQSGRSRLVSVKYIGNLEAALLHGGDLALKLFCYECSDSPLRKLLERIPEDVGVMCGPEGGFSAPEAALAIKLGWREVSLGRRILRSETAPVAALSILMYEAQDI